MTKRELLRYAAQIAPYLLPYLRRRALNMHRFPSGAGAKGFWHKELPGHAPDWLPRWDNPDADQGETRTYLVVDEPAALIWAANFGALEWHAWTSLVDRAAPAHLRADRPRPGRGDQLGGPARAGPAAPHRAGAPRRARRPKVTGRRGIQIWVPIARGPELRRHPRVGRAAVEDGRRGRTGAGQLEVAGARPRAGWRGWTTRRTRSTRPWSPPTARGRRRARRSRRRSTGTNSTTRSYGPDRLHHPHDLAAAGASGATCSAVLSSTISTCPRCTDPGRHLTARGKVLP